MLTRNQTFQICFQAANKLSEMFVRCGSVANMFFMGTVLLMFAHVSARSINTCDANRLIVYRVYLNTMWNRDVFPKQYPEWRPPAQWSKLVGE